MLRWIPWRYFVTRTARAYGFLDPIHFLGKLRGFAHPSEVSEPIELLRAGVLFHARGLVNTKAIQNNLDWVWPYWVERQFNPADRSFIPRAFSFSHINLTHRNWTAVGLPDVPYYPIVDPRGLVTPLFDGWSLDFWLIHEDGRRLIPSKLDEAEQELEYGENLRVHTRFREHGWELSTHVSMEMAGQRPHCVIRVEAKADPGTQLALVVRPYNPEGVSFIEMIASTPDREHWLINGKNKVSFDRPARKFLFSNYKKGDVCHFLPCGDEALEITCPVSMASAAAIFSLDTIKQRPLEIHAPIVDELEEEKKPRYQSVPRWENEMASFSRLQVPDEKIQRLYDLSVATLVLHSPGEVYPGPYTYKRFWYRDAAFMLHAIVSLGSRDRAKRALDLFPDRQQRDGYFLSQEGEWDSNGEAIWIMHRYLQLTGEKPPDRWLESIQKGARWIIKKRLPRDLKESHAGLLPAGFSAEHLGPNDYYYWDNFWGVAGLRCAAELMRPIHPDTADEFQHAADDFLDTIIASFKHIPERRYNGAISASPHRRMDAGAIGSIVADYPLQLFPPGEERMMKTVDYLVNHSSFNGGFFQNMIHSGINAYLTVELAQVLLRAGDARGFDLIDTVARLASPTGQWPEAIHPSTLGGCMGDGQHAWAAAEWAVMIRNLFAREETGRLVIGAGLFPRWLRAREPMHFGPTLTPFGSVSVDFEPYDGGRFKARIDAQWFNEAPVIDVSVPGWKSVEVEKSSVYLIEPLA